MKCYFWIGLTSLLLPIFSGCYKSDVEDLQGRVQTLENQTIKSINEQIASIKSSITSLEATDTKLDNHINTLQNTANELQKSLNETNAKIETVRTELLNTIDSKKAEVLAELENLRSSLEGEIKLINESIKALQDKDESLSKDIQSLKNYVDTEIGNTKTWADATFSTLEQYQTISKDISGIKTTIDGIQTSITELETRVNTKIKNDIDAASKDLKDSLRLAVSDITTAYTLAISEAKTDITAAYTEAIKTAIENSEASIQGWVNEQLKAYYTITETDSKLDVLKTALETQLSQQKTSLEQLIDDLSKKTDNTFKEKDAQIKILKDSLCTLDSKIENNATDIESLRGDLNQMKIDITKEYQSAIKTAIEEFDGKMDSTVTARVVAINKSIVDGINSRLDVLESDVAQLKTDVSTLFSSLNTNVEHLQKQIDSLLAQVQSIVLIPDYSDGSAKLDIEHTDSLLLNFEVLPRNVAKRICDIGISCFSLDYKYTETKAALTLDHLPIFSISGDSDGIISIFADATAIDRNTFLRKNGISTNIKLTISNDRTCRSSEFYKLSPYLKNGIDVGISVFWIDAPISDYEYYLQNGWIQASLENFKELDCQIKRAEELNSSSPSRLKVYCYDDKSVTFPIPAITSTRYYDSSGGTNIDWWCIIGYNYTYGYFNKVSSRNYEIYGTTTYAVPVFAIQ